MDIQAEIKKVRDEMDKMLTACEAEKRGFSDDEQVRYDGLDIKMRGLDASASQTRRSIPIPGVQRAESAEPENEFQTRGIVGGLGTPVRLFWNGRVPASERNIRQYLSDVVQGKTLIPDEERAMSIGTGVAGGFAAPEAWAAGFWSSVNSESVFLSRCRVFPFQGTNTLHVTAWDSEAQNAGPFGGVGAQWTAEGGTFTAVTPSIRTIMLKAHKLGIFVDISREAAQNAGNLMAELGTQMVRAASYHYDDAIMNGTGLGQPLGLLKTPSVIDVNRAVGSQIAYADIANLYRRLHPNFLAGAAWFVSPDCIGQLLAMADAANHLIWMPNSTGVANARPGYLLGLPVFLSDKVAPLGSRGDVVLADMSAYAIGVAQDVILEKTESARWFTDQYSLRSILRGDGCALMDNPITPKNNGATLSWAVVLDA